MPWLRRSRAVRRGGRLDVGTTSVWPIVTERWRPPSIAHEADGAATLPPVSDPELEAFRAKLKQGRSMAPAYKKRIVRGGSAFAVGVLVCGGALFAEHYQKQRSRDAITAALQADRAEEEAFDQRFASLSAEVRTLDLATVGQADPSLARGRRVVGINDSGTVVLGAVQRRGGANLAADAAQVGVVVHVSGKIHEDQPVRYEGGGVRFPVTYTLHAIAWPEKKLLASWRRRVAPPPFITGGRGDPIGLGGDGSLPEKTWQEDVDALAAGKAPLPN